MWLFVSNSKFQLRTLLLKCSILEDIYTGVIRVTSMFSFRYVIMPSPNQWNIFSTHQENDMLLGGCRLTNGAKSDRSTHFPQLTIKGVKTEFQRHRRIYLTGWTYINNNFRRKTFYKRRKKGFKAEKCKLCWKIYVFEDLNIPRIHQLGHEREQF